MLSIKKESAWKFVTSSSGGIGVEFIAAEGGVLYFQDPSQNQMSFRYGGAGVGLYAGLKLPKVGKVKFPTVQGKSVGGAVAPTAFPNAGKIYIFDSFPGDELSASDIRGVCMFVEAGGGFVAGASATAMIFGMDPIWLGGIVATLGMPFMIPIMESHLLNSATGLLVMAGLNVGVQAGGGAAAFLGGLY